MTQTNTHTRFETAALGALALEFHLACAVPPITVAVVCLSVRNSASPGGYFAALMLSLVMNVSLVVRMNPSGNP
jgi:hypothetical protein